MRIYSQWLTPPDPALVYNCQGVKITKKSNQLDIAAGLENILFNAGTMVKNKGFRKAKAYLVEQINEAYFSSLELRIFSTR